MTYYINCTDRSLGRACVEACNLHKNKYYQADKIIFTGKLNIKKQLFYKHTGRNCHELSGQQLGEDKPLYTIRRTLKSMLPNNKTSLMFLKSIEYQAIYEQNN